MTLDIVFTMIMVACWLLMAGFFSGAETGLYSVNRFRLSARAAEDDPNAVRLRKLLSRPADLIVTLLIGTNLSIYVATAASTNLARSLLPGDMPMLPAIVTTLIMSPLVLVFAEMVPKEIFRRRPWRLAYTTSRAVKIFSILFKLPVLVLRLFVMLVEGTLGMSGEKADPFFSRQQLADLITVGVNEGVISAYQADMAGKVMKLGKVKLSNVMIPLDKVTMVERNTAVDRFLDIAEKRRHSRIPVFDRVRTSVVGVVNIFDTFYEPDRGTSVEDYCESPIRLADTTTATHALSVLQRKKRVMALVVDTDDQPVGVVTVKDLVEEIAGDLADW